MMNTITQAKRLRNFDKPTVWTIMTQIAQQTKAINLGQGSPSQQPPKFYLQYLNQAKKQCNHQYTRAFGSLQLVNAIAKYHKRYKYDPQNQIVTVNGAGQGLLDIILAFIDPGDQVVFFDPSYDCYRAQVQMAGGHSIGIPLKPKHQQNKASIKQRCKQSYFSGQLDEWEIDFIAFQKALNQKSKMLILNSPHNPMGKVFKNQQIKKIASILEKFPRVMVVQDNVYEGMTYDDMFEKQLPKLSYYPGFFQRTVSVYSGGKIFGATGSRSGWVIGSAKLIQSIRSVHQYNVFCAYSILQATIAKSLETISKPNNTYIRDNAIKLTKRRNLLLDQLIASKFDFDLWIPKGGYFIIADISRIQVDQKYLFGKDGKKLAKDFAFCFQLAYENGIVAIPCSAFYAKQAAHLGQKYIRFAYCKDEQTIKAAGKRLKQYNLGAIVYYQEVYIYNTKIAIIQYSLYNFHITQSQCTIIQNILYFPIFF